MIEISFSWIKSFGSNWTNCCRPSPIHSDSSWIIQINNTVESVFIAETTAAVFLVHRPLTILISSINMFKINMINTAGFNPIPVRSAKYQNIGANSEVIKIETSDSARILKPSHGVVPEAGLDPIRSVLNLVLVSFPGNPTAKR